MNVRKEVKNVYAKQLGFDALGVGVIFAGK